MLLPGAVDARGAALAGGKHAREIERVRIADGPRDLGDMHRRAAQQGARRFQPGLPQQGGGGAAEALHEAAVEPAAAHPGKGGDVVDGDGLGVVVLDIGRRAVDDVSAVLWAFPSLDELAEQQVGIAQHLRPAPRGLAARLVDRGDVALERPPEVDVQHGRVRAQVRARQQGGGIRPAEAEPVVFPRRFRVCLVAHHDIRPDEKDLARAHGEGPPGRRERPAAGNDVVDEIVIPHARAPAVAGCALLKPDIFYRQRQSGAVGFIGILEVNCHDTRLPYQNTTKGNKFPYQRLKIPLHPQHISLK